MKTTSRLALAAAAGLMLSAAMTPVKAADLGGGCCADLEERVAELEATTARKGNRVVSLQIYGQVNKGLLIWDNGIDSDAYVADNEVSSSRVGFKGKATIAPGWTAGYNMEFDVSDSNSSVVTEGQGGDEGDNLRVRQNYWFIESDKLGRISVGQQSDAADGATEVVLGNSMRSSNVAHGDSIGLTMTNNGVSSYVGMQLKDWANNLDGTRQDLIRYDSPSIFGFLLSASWGENDYADVALRLKKEFGSFRFVGGIGYVWAHDSVDNKADIDVEELAGSASLMHVPTGLYIAFAAANREYTDTDLQDSSMWYLQAGIEKKFNSLGSTTFYGEYGVYKNGLGAQLKGAVNDAEATRWGLGVNQKVDSAAMDIYANATFWSFDDSNTGHNYEDLTTVMLGSRIQF